MAAQPAASNSSNSASVASLVGAGFHPQQAAALATMLLNVNAQHEADSDNGSNRGSSNRSSTSGSDRKDSERDTADRRDDDRKNERHSNSRVDRDDFRDYRRDGGDRNNRRNEGNRGNRSSNGTSSSSSSSSRGTSSGQVSRRAANFAQRPECLACGNHHYGRPEDCRGSTRCSKCGYFGHARDYCAPEDRVRLTHHEAMVARVFDSNKGKDASSFRRGGTRQ